MLPLLTAKCRQLLQTYPYRCLLIGMTATYFVTPLLQPPSVQPRACLIQPEPGGLALQPASTKSLERSPEAVETFVLFVLNGLYKSSQYLANGVQDPGQTLPETNFSLPTPTWRALLAFSDADALRTDLATRLFEDYPTQQILQGTLQTTLHLAQVSRPVLQQHTPPTWVVDVDGTQVWQNLETGQVRALPIQARVVVAAIPVHTTATTTAQRASQSASSTSLSAATPDPEQHRQQALLVLQQTGLQVIDFYYLNRTHQGISHHG